MPPAPINLRVVNDRINGQAAALAWDPDPTQTGVVQKHDIQRVDAAGVVTYLDFAPLSGTNEALIALPGGTPMDVQVTVKINNATSLPSNRITVTPQPAPAPCPPPPPPPPPLTSKEHLEAAFGRTFVVGDTAEVSETMVSKRIQADGSLL